MRRILMVVLLAVGMVVGATAVAQAARSNDLVKAFWSCGSCEYLTIQCPDGTSFVDELSGTGYS